MGGCSICRGVALSEAEFPPEPRPRRGLGREDHEGGGVGLLSEGGSPSLERGGDGARCRRPWRGGLERGGDYSAGSREPRMGRTAMLGRGPSVYWALQEPGEDLSVVGELQMLHGIQVQSDDVVVIIGGFFLSRIAVE